MLNLWALKLKLLSCLLLLLANVCGGTREFSIGPLLTDLRWFLQRTKRTPMMVSAPAEIPEYELNPGEVQFRRGCDVTPVQFSFFLCIHKHLFKNASEIWG
jgi:hypothetical protein